MTANDSNAHRKGKAPRFEAVLTFEEHYLIDRVKAKVSVTTDRQLIVALCNKLLNKGK